MSFEAGSAWGRERGRASRARRGPAGPMDGRVWTGGAHEGRPMAGVDDLASASSESSCAGGGDMPVVPPELDLGLCDTARLAIATLAREGIQVRVRGLDRAHASTLSRLPG